MGSFELPTNIKQMGSIGEGIRIYFEEYAYSFFQQYAENGGYDERMGVLIGRKMVIDNQNMLFVTGAILAPHLHRENDINVFTSKTWQYVDEVISKYFKGLEVVGWALSQPGFGVFLSEACGQYQRSNFQESHKVIFVTDPVENMSVFYAWGEEGARSGADPGDPKNGGQARRPIESRGYFIYYDKNKGMHEYMLDNTMAKLESDTAGVKQRETKAGGPKLQPERRELKAAAGRRPAYQPPGRLLNMLATLSAVLFVICFIMGAGLIQNDGRLTDLEAQLTQLNTAYRDLMVEAKNGNTTAVFSNQGDQNRAASAAAGQDQAPAAASNKDAAQPGQSAAQADAQQNAQSGANQPGNGVQAAQPPEQSLPAQAAGPNAAQENTMANMDIPNSGIPSSYRVQSGDTLNYISLKFYGSLAMVEKIMQANNLTDKDKIILGKVLRLPQP